MLPCAPQGFASFSEIVFIPFLFIMLLFLLTFTFLSLTDSHTHAYTRHSVLESNVGRNAHALDHAEEAGINSNQA